MQAGQWPRVPLGDVLSSVQAGFASGERSDDGVIQLRMNNVDTEGQIIWDRFIRVPATAEMMDEYRLQPDDVVFNNTNSTELVGKSARFESHDEPVVYSNHFTRLRARTDVLCPAYLGRWLNHQWRVGTFAEMCNKWIGQSAVKTDKLLALTIPLPPLAEQERIARRLTSELAAVDQARAAAADRLAAAQALPTAYLRNLFDCDSRQWRYRRIDEVCDLLPSKSIASDGDTPVKAITTACLSERGFVPSGIKVARMYAADIPDCLVRRGEILVARSNTPELVGRASMYAGEPADVVASDLTIRLIPRPLSDGLDSQFLAMYLSFLFQTGHWRERAGGASGTMKKITRTQISAEQVPNPPPAEQRRIAAELTRRLEGAQRLAAALAAELAALEALPAALLRRAFEPQAGVQPRSGDMT